MAAMPTPGDLRHTVAIEEPETPATTDAHGQLEPTWRRITTRRACIRDLTGGELWLLKQTESVASFAVDLRYFARLAKYEGGVHQGPLMRLVQLDRFGNDERVLNVESVRNPDRKKIWHLVFVKA